MNLKNILNQGGAAATVAAATLAAAFASTSASAQPGSDAACPPAGAERRIAFGDCRSSSLGAGDARTAEDLPYEDWRLRLESDRPVQIEMDAAAAPVAAGEPDVGQPSFDAYLELRRDGVEEPLAANDDRPGSLNSRLRYTPTESGDYVVRARPLASSEGGDYVLRVGAAPPPPVPVPLEPGRTQGSIDRSAPESETMGGYRTRHYTFQGNAGDRIRLALQGPNAGSERAQQAPTTPYEPMGPQAMIQLEGPSDWSLGADSMEGGQANLVAILQETGRYVLQVHLPEAETAQPFTLEFERRAAGPAAPPRPIRIGETVSGELGLSSPDAADPYGEGRRILTETFVLRVQAGQPVTVTLESPAFDTVLEAGDTTVLGFASAFTNDDYGDGLNSRLVLTPERSGTVQLRVRALGTGAGPFQLRVEPGAAAPLAEPEGDGHHH